MSKSSKRRQKRKGSIPGAKHRRHEPDKVQVAAGMYVDQAQKRVVFTTTDMLWNQLRRDTPKIEISFDKICEQDVSELSELFGKTSGICMAGLAASHSNNDVLRNTCAVLVINSFCYFTSALQILRAGYRLQPATLLRSVIECLCVVLHLMVKPEDLNAFHAGSLKSTKTVTTANRAIPQIGSLYGHLSNDFTHIRTLHQQHQPLSEYSEKDDALTVNLNLLRATSWLTYVTVELLFHDIVASPKYWTHLGGGKYAYDPSDEEREWMENFYQIDDSESAT